MADAKGNKIAKNYHLDTPINKEGFMLKEWTM